MKMIFFRPNFIHSDIHRMFFTAHFMACRNSIRSCQPPKRRAWNVNPASSVISQYRKAGIERLPTPLRSSITSGTCSYICPHSFHHRSLLCSRSLHNTVQLCQKSRFFSVSFSLLVPTPQLMCVLGRDVCESNGSHCCARFFPFGCLVEPSLFVLCVCGYHFQQTGHQPGMVAKPARGQVNMKNGIFPVPVRT